MDARMRTPLTGEDIVELVGGVPIHLYKDLQDVVDVSDLLDESGKCVLLYPLETNQSGHWVCLFTRGPDAYEFFDSYGTTQGGGQVDSPLSWIPKTKLEEFGVHDAYLRRLLRKSGAAIIINKAALQDKNPQIATCGRHVAVRLSKRAVPLKIYVRQLKSQNESPDEFVTNITYDALGH
jgi:hypothetical protein